MLACSTFTPAEVSAAPAFQEVSDSEAQEATAELLWLESHLSSLSPPALSEARSAARDLVTSCPYNHATLELLLLLKESLSPDTDPAVREGVASMSRVLVLLDLAERPELIFGDNLFGVDLATDWTMSQAEAELSRVSEVVALLTPAELDRIDDASERLTVQISSRWPPKSVLIGWRESIRLTQPELAAIMDAHMSQRC
ncbi:MAG: hypothetical protein ACI8S6_004146 [Myxococcota bacterium]|jgi:hypothetical protein